MLGCQLAQEAELESYKRSCQDCKRPKLLRANSSSTCIVDMNAEGAWPGLSIARTQVSATLP